MGRVSSGDAETLWLEIFFTHPKQPLKVTLGLHSGLMRDISGSNETVVMHLEAVRPIFKGLLQLWCHGIDDQVAEHQTFNQLPASIHFETIEPLPPH